jgi:hypothetical protein
VVEHYARAADLGGALHWLLSSREGV